MTEIPTAKTFDSLDKKGIQESPYFVMLVLFLGVFMMGLDLYIFSPALVTIVNYFNTSYDWVSWTLTIYLLFTTAVLPLAGKLADVFGRKKIYIIGVFLFTLGSFLSSLSWDIYSLVIFRAVQAIGGGIIVPSALSAMSSYASKDKQGKTLGILMSASSLATIIGPNIGGYLIENFGWRSIFYLNIPIGILTIVLALIFKETYSQTKHHIDIIGAILLFGAITCLVLGLNGLETLPFSNIAVFPYFLASLLLFGILLFYETHTVEPLLNIPLLMQGKVFILNLGFLLTFAASITAVAFVPSFVQLVLKLGVEISGSILTPLSVTILFMAIVGGILVDKFGTKLILLVGTSIGSLGLFLLANYAYDYLSLIIILVILGISLGISSSAFPVAIFAIVPEEEKGSSIAILNTFKGIGSILAPLMGGYYLTNATNHVITFSNAFSTMFFVACLLLIIAVILLLAFVIFPKNVFQNLLTYISKDRTL